MSFQELFKLKENPFRVVPASAKEDIIWAGFPELKKSIKDRIKKSLKIRNSSIILNWGEYGSGKTHALRYFTRLDILARIANEVKTTIPFPINFTLPKGKNPIYEIYISIIDLLDISNIRANFEEIQGQIESFIPEITSNLHIQKVIEAIFSDLDESLLKKYLYNNVTASELRELNEYGILRRVESESDYCKIIAGIFSCLTYNKIKYSCILIWIDEFEDIALMSNSNVDKLNNFIRELFDNTPNNLLLFLNLTQTAFITNEDLGEYLSGALKSRLKERINFEIPDENQIKLYLDELLNHKNFRTNTPGNKFFPFEESAILGVIETLQTSSLRKYNETFSLLLELAELEEKSPIDNNFLLANKSEILGWKE